MLMSELSLASCWRSAWRLSITFTLPPISVAVSASWPSRSVRSFTSTILWSLRSRLARSMRARNTMVSDLPEPCVCHTTPLRSSAVWPLRSRSTTLPAARNCW